MSDAAMFIDGVDRDQLHRDIYVAVLTASNKASSDRDNGLMIARAQRIADQATAAYQPYRDQPQPDRSTP